MIYAIVVVLVLIADQAVKYLTTVNIPYPDGSGTLIPGLIGLRNVHNDGAAFSILEGAQWFLVAVSLVFVIAVIVLISREVIHTKFGRWTAVLVIAGALGNCIDRILYGYVVDMFKFEGFLDWFPVFNVADIFITVCGLAFCVHLLFHREPEAVKAANEPEFMRRRRAEKEAREVPLANIPKRGQHKTLEEELRPVDPEDLFAEWGFGSEVEDDKPARSGGARPQDTQPLYDDYPQKTQPLYDDYPQDTQPLYDDYPQDTQPLYDDYPQESGRARRPEPPSPPDPEPEEYSLEDILSEFGDY